MSETLEQYRKGYNDLIGALEKEPSGDHKAFLKAVLQRMHDEIIKASNLEDEGKDATKVFDRIDLLFNRL